MNPAIDKSTSVDNVVPERKLRCAPPRWEPGGGGINVSRALHRLGGASTAFYPAGGYSGDRLQDLLDEEGIDHRPIPIERDTRENLIIYEESTDQQFRFGMPGAELKEEEWRRFPSKIAEMEPAPDYLVASGSLPPGVPEDFYSRLANLAQERDIRMVLDTSGTPFVRAVEEAQIYLIKPNMRELSQLAGRELDKESEQEDFVKRLIEKGHCEVVVISRGAGGALAVWREGCEHLRAPSVPIKSKVGAGDSMVAGIVLSLAQGNEIVEAVRFGVAAGAAAVMTPGTELCRGDDAAELYAQLQRGEAGQQTSS
jgi:6-phosphofructokinase 2